MPWELATRRQSPQYAAPTELTALWIPTAIKIWLLPSRGSELRNRRLSGPRQRGPSMQANDLYGSNVTLTDVNPEITMSIPF
jgi:hypothetical protein